MPSKRERRLRGDEPAKRRRGAQNDPHTEAPLPAAAPAGESPVDAAFERCKQAGVAEGEDAARDAISGMGLVKLCEEVGVDPYDDPFIYTFAFLAQAKEPMTLSRAEFKSALARIGCSSLQAVRPLIEALRAHAGVNWRELWAHAFAFSREGSGARVIAGESAVNLVRVLLPLRSDPGAARSWPLLDRFARLLGVPEDDDAAPPAAAAAGGGAAAAAAPAAKPPRAVTRDEWGLLPVLIDLGKSLKGYDNESSWPCLFDDFVDAVRADR